MTFKRPTYEQALAKNQRRRQQQREQQRQQHQAAPAHKPIPRQPRVYEKLVASAVVSIAKTPRLRNQRLLDLARGRPCLLRIPGICRGENETTVACHGNSSTFGKGLGRKADDHYTVWGCARCHTWLDSSYAATGEEREQAFLAAMLRQIAEWGDMAKSSSISPRDRAAAAWAIQMHSEVA